VTEPELRGLAAEWRELKAAQTRLNEKEARLKKELTKALGDQAALPIAISDRERYVLKRVERDNRKPDLNKLATIAYEKGVPEEQFTLTLTEADAVRLLEQGILDRSDYEAVLKGNVTSYVEMRLQEVESDDGTA
jgi:hypothetical protein